MTTLDELKKTWHERQGAGTNPTGYDEQSFEKIIKSKTKKHITAAVNYFWASLALQILVYALLSHVIIKYWQDTEMRYFSFGGVLLFIPFTILLMRKFKSLATKPSAGNAGSPLYDYVLHQQTMLYHFYKFKKWYELFHVPLSIMVGVVVTFKLYVSGGVAGHWIGASIIFIISLLSCAAAIRAENKNSFERPIAQLQNVLDEFKRDG